MQPSHTWSCQAIGKTYMRLRHITTCAVTGMVRGSNAVRMHRFGLPWHVNLGTPLCNHALACRAPCGTGVASGSSQLLADQGHHRTLRTALDPMAACMTAAVRTACEAPGQDRNLKCVAVGPVLSPVRLTRGGTAYLLPALGRQLENILHIVEPAQGLTACQQCVRAVNASPCAWLRMSRPCRGHVRPEPLLLPLPLLPLLLPALHSL